MYFVLFFQDEQDRMNNSSVWQMADWGNIPAWALNADNDTKYNQGSGHIHPGVDYFKLLWGFIIFKCIRHFNLCQ